MGLACRGGVRMYLRRREVIGCLESWPLMPGFINKFCTHYALNAFGVIGIFGHSEKYDLQRAVLGKTKPAKKVEYAYMAVLSTPSLRPHRC